MVTTGLPTVLTQQMLLAPGRPRLRVSPFVKWAGGKGHLVRHLMPLVPIRLKNYYEPFLGGGALFFSVFNRGTPFRSFLSDSNHELISTFKVLEETPEELVLKLSKLQKQYLVSPHKEAFYYSVRATSPASRTELAARFIFLNKTCYNGLYRVNRKGMFNVPFGRYKHPRILNEANLLAASWALQDTGATIFEADYQKATEKSGEGDFVYFDPPYDPISKTSGFTDYTAVGFDKEDQIKLAEWFGELASRRCIVVLSNSDTPLVRRLYRKYFMKSIEVNRPINCKGKGRTGFKELVISNDPSNRQV